MRTEGQDKAAVLGGRVPRQKPIFIGVLHDCTHVFGRGNPESKAGFCLPVLCQPTLLTEMLMGFILNNLCENSVASQSE